MTRLCSSDSIKVGRAVFVKENQLSDLRGGQIIFLNHSEKKKWRQKYAAKGQFYLLIISSFRNIWNNKKNCILPQFDTVLTIFLLQFQGIFCFISRQCVKLMGSSQRSPASAPPHQHSTSICFSNLSHHLNFLTDTGFPLNCSKLIDFISPSHILKDV